jgi:YHS domain-containing protein
MRVAALALVSQVDGQITPCRSCEEGVVIGGYDVVEPFKHGAGQSRGVKGSRSYSVKHFGYEFWFHNAENLATFNENPSKYVPAYGGF